jgi:hypothetical protein
MSTVDVDSFAVQYDGLVARAASIKQQRDIAGVATPDEARQLAVLDRIEATLQKAPPGPKRDALADRARILRGTLVWQLDASYKARVSRLEHELKLTGAQLAEARRRVGLVNAADQQAPLDTAGFAARIDELGHRITVIQPKLDAAAAAQEKVLAAMAVDELKAQKRRLASYASQAAVRARRQSMTAQPPEPGAGDDAPHRFPSSRDIASRVRCRHAGLRSR